MEKVICAWSGGKDSALALHEAIKSGRYDVRALLTTVTEDYDRISMHGVRSELLEKQASAIGIGLEKVFISKNGSNDEYEAKMRQALEKQAALGVSGVIFGDIFLEDLKKYREDKLSAVKMKGIFPIWKANTAALANKFLDHGFRAVITCVDTKVMPREFAGRQFDESFLYDRPSGVDPCGENGEFHSFVYDGPIFRERVNFTLGDTVMRENRFCYRDILPVTKEK
jgi:uncharacterized protein (TIGR00290 family)